MSDCPECGVINYGINPRCVACVRKVMGDRIALLEARIHEAKEIYTGMEGFIPETAPEAYQKRTLDQMWEALQEQGE